MVFLAERRRVRGGMSLLEVVLALGILLMSLAALAQLISAGSRAAVDSQLQTEAVMRCQSKLAEVVSGGVQLQTAEGANFADDPRWRWSLLVQQTSEQNLFDVQVSVSRDGAAAAAIAEFSLRRYMRNPAAFVSERINEREIQHRQRTLKQSSVPQNPGDSGGKDADR